MPVAPAFLYQSAPTSSYRHLSWSALKHKHIWKNSLWIPAVGAILSLTILLVQLISKALKKQNAPSEDKLRKGTTSIQSEALHAAKDNFRRFFREKF
ncbi:hypothetical protein CPB83DRAFT_864273 [Crepidotus variabilis]|uniref:Uncharacterized protein n=1 Tax=Crepidotus variabilis TaxID=179855 RepID=A0A9P6E537_9AGAR|nr:hypothetical protein CPB83DRAFT_864273 [Crepidotus variabilis]